MSRLSEAAIQGFERAVTGRVEKMFAALQALPQGVEEISIPNIGISFDPRHPAIYISAAHWAVKALAARYWAEQQRPDLPPLPLDYSAIERMQDDPDPLLSDWGWYAGYLHADPAWDIRNRSAFDNFRGTLRRLGVGKPKAGQRVTVEMPSDLTKFTVHYAP